jgi:hypothetical protein
VGAIGNTHADEVVVALVKLSMTIGVSAANAVVANIAVTPMAKPQAADPRRSVPANGNIFEPVAGLPMSGEVYCPRVRDGLD